MTSVGDRRIRTFVLIYIIEKVADAHAQNTTLEWFSSSPGLGVEPRRLS